MEQRNRSVRDIMKIAFILALTICCSLNVSCKKSGGGGVLLEGRKKSGLFAIRIGDKWGYIDRKGQIVINPQFDLANGFPYRHREQ